MNIKIKNTESVFDSKFGSSYERNVDTVKKNAEALIVASMEIGLEVNADKTKYMVMSQDQNAGQSHHMKIDKSSF